MPSPVPSAGRRAISRYGAAFVQALLLGSLFGALAYFRLPRVRDEDPESRPPLYGIRKPFETLELATYDWRAQELGQLSQPADDVVLVAATDQTRALSRSRAGWGPAGWPWSRETIGNVAKELVDEGASLVVLDWPLADTSRWDDDARLRAQLDAIPGKSLLGFQVSQAGRAAIGTPELTPFALLVSREPRIEDEWDKARRVLADGKRLFVVPAAGAVELWAGVGSQDEGRELAQIWELPASAEIRPTTSQDLDHAWTAVDLLINLSEVEVSGISASDLTPVDALEPPVAALLDPKSRFGSVSESPDVDGAIRGVPHLFVYRTRKDGRDHILPSAALRAAMELAGTRELSYRNGRLEIGKRFSVPMDASGFSLLRWDRPQMTRFWGSLNRGIDAWNILVNQRDAAEGRPRHYATSLERKVAIVTDASSEDRDWRPTPIASATPLAAIQGQALLNILHSEGIQRTDPVIDFGVTFALAFLGALLALAFSGGLRSVGGTALFLLSVSLAAAAYLLGARSLLIHRQLWVATAGPLLALGSTFLLTAISTLRDEREVRELIFSVLGPHIRPETARQVARDTSLLRPARRRVTVLFSDIEGFGAISARLNPERVAQLLNVCFTEMGAAVRANDGFVDAYVGDAMMSLFGAPLPLEGHALHACEAALEMRAALFRQQEDWEKRFGQRIRFQIGINSGEVVVGDLGTAIRPNYTAMGEPVAFASLLEATNAALNTSVLVGPATVEQAGRSFVFREVDRVRVDPFADPVAVYELMGHVDALSPGRARQMEPFARALDAYRQQRFRDAVELFRRGAEVNDPVAAVYVERCRHYLDGPPPEDWDGVYDPTLAPIPLVPSMGRRSGP